MTHAAGPAAVAAALPAHPRPEPPGALAASAAFGSRALLKIRHVPEILLDVIAIPVVFTLMFTYLFGGALAGSPHRYLQFILPGTLVMAVLLVTMYAGSGLAADRDRGISERFRSLPIWRLAPITGALLGDIARYLLAAALVVALLAMGFRPAGRPGRRAGRDRPAAGLRALRCPGPGPPSALLLRTPPAVTSTATVTNCSRSLWPATSSWPRTPCRAGYRPSCASTRSATWSPPSTPSWPATRPPGARLGAARLRGARRRVRALTGWLYGRSQ